MTQERINTGNVLMAKSLIAEALGSRDKKIVIREPSGAISGALSYSPNFGGYYIENIGSLKAGLGTQMVNQLIMIAKQAGIPFLVVKPTSDSAPFWHRLGFKPEGAYAVRHLSPSKNTPQTVMKPPRDEIKAFVKGNTSSEELFANNVKNTRSYENDPLIKTISTGKYSR